jgi:hypothetical protein
MFIYPAIEHDKELWRVEYRDCLGHLKSVRGEATIKMVREWTRQNPLWKQKIMSRKLNISTQLSRLIRDHLHMTVHLRSKGQLLTPALKEIRWTRAKRLLQRHAENRHENTLFTDEKIFTIQEQ